MVVADRVNQRGEAKQRDKLQAVAIVAIAVLFLCLPSDQRHVAHHVTLSLLY